MDKATKNYIDDIVKPMIYRIEYLEKSNQQLKIQIKYLESLILNGIKSYQKPTVSATYHMREGKQNSRENSLDKRPQWDRKTKIDQSPTADLYLSLDLRQTKEQKIKNKPPPPRNIKSSNKQSQNIKNSGYSRQESKNGRQQFNKEKNNLSSQKMDYQSSKNEIKNNQNEYQNPFEQNKGQIKERWGQIGWLNNKFQQLVFNNTQILTSMKQNNEKVRMNSKSKEAYSNNYVEKVDAPKSQYSHQSQIASPTNRSFTSESHPYRAQAKA